MSTLSTGPCELDGWIIDRTSGCWDIPADTPEETIEIWRRVAAEYLYMVTGQRLGKSCAVAVRPCRKSCAEDFFGSRFFQGYQTTGGWIPYMRDGLMYNASICGCATDCHCGPELCEIEVPGPIFSVTKIDIDGITVDPVTYGYLDARRIVRRSDAATIQPELPGCWPTCQDLSLPPGQPNTFTVYYSTGQAVPFMASQALTQLAAHYIKGCSGCGCGIGSRNNLQSLTRQGVQMEFVDPQQVFSDGRTGLELVDAFVRAYNPGKLAKYSRVMSPDAPQRPPLWTGP